MGLSPLKIANKFEKDLYLFFIIAFAWSWLLWLPEILWGMRLYLAPFGPTIAAFILIYMNEGLDGAKELLKRGLDFSLGKIWFIPIFLLMPAIVGFSLLLAVLSGKSTPSMPVLSQPWIIIPAFFYILFFGGPVAEEFGWRGYALDRLQRQYNALLSSIILDHMGIMALTIILHERTRDIPERANLGLYLAQYYYQYYSHGYTILEEAY